ncbi:hypothetical protein AO501_28480, partial [Mycobacterium gordonae]
MAGGSLTAGLAIDAVQTAGRVSCSLRAAYPEVATGTARTARSALASRTVGALLTEQQPPGTADAAETAASAVT